MNKIARISRMQPIPEGGIYIGRRTGILPQSPYHNPFLIGSHGTREEVLRKFKEYWFHPEQKALRWKAWKELPGKTLYCWCAPLACHGDVIALYLDWMALFMQRTTNVDH